MAKIVTIGAGVVGLGVAMLLANDGHDVTVLERDAMPPTDTPEEAWEQWQRRGVNQFRLPHFFLARYRAIMEAELPSVVEGIDAAGGLRFNPLLGVPESIRGPERPEDAQIEVLTARRPIMEQAVSAAVASTPRLDVRRGVAVESLLVGASAHNGIPHITGVRTEDGDEYVADLVVDMTGRRSPLLRWLEAVGANPPREELEDSGFMYMVRHYRSPDGSLPFAFGGGLQHFGTISTLSLQADHGTWGVGIVTSANDKALLALRDAERWETAMRSLPLVAHWLDGQPLEDRVVTMSKIEDRIRVFDPEGSPVVSGLVAVGDAWACSNPSLGRGASIGMLHGQMLRDRLRDVGLDDPIAFQEAFNTSTHRDVEPWFTWTRWNDRHRLAQVDAEARGQPYVPDDPDWEFEQSLNSAAGKDPDLFRIMIRGAMVIERPMDAAWTPALRERVAELGGDWRDDEIAAPSRDELVKLANA